MLPLAAESPWLPLLACEGLQKAEWWKTSCFLAVVFQICNLVPTTGFPWKDFLSTKPLQVMASPKCPVVVIRHPLHHVKQRPWGTANGPVPVVSDSHVNVSCVKILKVLIQWHKILYKRGRSLPLALFFFYLICNWRLRENLEDPFKYFIRKYFLSKGLWVRGQAGPINNCKNSIPKEFTL